MLKNKSFIMMSLAIILLVFIPNKMVFANQDKVILIDPGHGGIDGGAVSKSGVVEKNVNLDISLLLKQKLEAKGYRVTMTRETDIGLYKEGQKVKQKKREDLENRVKMKKATNCDAFVSIHQNIFPEAKYKGTQVWYCSNGTKSKLLADTIQSNVKEKIDKDNNRVSKPAGTQFRILRDNIDAASVIVECGFLSNEEECRLLTTKEYQDKIAGVLADSIETYFNSESKAQS